MSTVWGEIVGPRDLRIYGMHAHALEGFRRGERLRISVDRDRNGKFSALYHVMLGKLASAINRGPATTNIDQLKKWVKLRKGYYDVVPLPRPVEGQTSAIEYRSTAFSKMAEGEFHKFAQDTCELIRAELAPWVADAPEWPEINAILSSIEPAREGAA